MAGKPKYEEVTKRVNLSLTPKAIGELDRIAVSLGLRSRSDLVERFARGMVAAGDCQLEEQVLGEPSDA